MDGTLDEIALLRQSAENASASAAAALPLLVLFWTDWVGEESPWDELGCKVAYGLFRKIERALSGNPKDFWRAWRWTIGYGDLAGFTPSMLLNVTDEEYGRLVFGKDPNDGDDDGWPARI